MKYCSEVKLQGMETNFCSFLNFSLNDVSSSVVCFGSMFLEKGT